MLTSICIGQMQHLYITDAFRAICAREIMQVIRLPARQPELDHPDQESICSACLDRELEIDDTDHTDDMSEVCNVLALLVEGGDAV